MVKKHQTSANCELFYKITDCAVQNGQETQRTRNCSRLMEIKGTQHINRRRGWRLDLGMGGARAGHGMKFEHKLWNR